MVYLLSIRPWPRISDPSQRRGIGAAWGVTFKNFHFPITTIPCFILNGDYLFLYFDILRFNSPDLLSGWDEGWEIM